MSELLRLGITAPGPFNIGGEKHNPVTVKMIAGELTDPAAIAGHVDRFLMHHLELVTAAARAGAEVVLLTENCLRLGGLIRNHGGAPWCRQAVDDALELWIRRVGAVCRERRVTVIGGTLVHRDSRYFNTAIAQGPDGQLIGCYDKTHLPRDEAEFLAAGDSLPVFDAPFGRFGMLICWDIMFPEAFGALALRGAQIVFQPTFGHDGEASDITARARAMDWSIPLAVSMWNKGSVLVDAAGNILARADSEQNPLAVAELDLATKRQVGFMEDARVEKIPLRRPDIYLSRKQ